MLEKKAEGSDEKANNASDSIRPILSDIAGLEWAKVGLGCVYIVHLRKLLRGFLLVV